MPNEIKMKKAIAAISDVHEEAEKNR